MVMIILVYPLISISFRWWMMNYEGIEENEWIVNEQIERVET